MQFLLTHVLMRRQSQDSIRVLAETLSLVERQELKVSAFVALQSQFKLDHALLVLAQRLQAGVVLPYKALKLS